MDSIIIIIYIFIYNSLNIAVYWDVMLYRLVEIYVNSLEQYASNFRTYQQAVQ